MVCGLDGVVMPTAIVAQPHWGTLLLISTGFMESSKLPCTIVWIVRPDLCWAIVKLTHRLHLWIVSPNPIPTLYLYVSEILVHASFNIRLKVIRLLHHIIHAFLAHQYVVPIVPIYLVADRAEEAVSVALHGMQPKAVAVEFRLIPSKLGGGCLDCPNVGRVGPGTQPHCVPECPFLLCNSFVAAEWANLVVIDSRTSGYPLIIRVLPSSVVNLGLIHTDIYHFCFQPVMPLVQGFYPHSHLQLLAFHICLRGKRGDAITVNGHPFVPLIRPVKISDVHLPPHLVHLQNFCFGPFSYAVKHIKLESHSKICNSVELFVFILSICIDPHILSIIITTVNFRMLFRKIICFCRWG
mmetsp:Transcript_8068/g.10707  ORF Transcript_8068/g.10707 Transcript_8068/m.10707 type:complete len:353 (-) Transcript_8068:272-1330(-)